MNDKKTITVEELQEKLNRKEPVFILDVRPREQRQEWHIAESTHIDAYTRLNNGDPTVLDEIDLPKDTAVVAVCAAGRTSLMATNELRKKGIEAYSLDGGMKAWNYAWNTAEVNFENELKVIQVRRAAKGCLSYVVGSEEEAIVIDASLEPDVYIKLAEKNSWRIKYVLDTHIHADYVSRTRELAQATNAKLLLIDKANVDYEFIPVVSGESAKFGRTFIEFLYTPGHTWESTAFKIDNRVVFTGDTLFVDGIGRPDLKADQNEAVLKARALYHSLKDLLSLSPSTLVLPAHTSEAISFDHAIVGRTIAEVKDSVNLLQLNEEEFIAYTLSRIPPTPPNYATIASLNKLGSFQGYNLADLEAGGNHCAVA